MASTLVGSGNMPSVVSIKPLYLTLCCLNLSFASLVPTTANMEHLLSPGRVLWIISVLLYLNIQGNLTFRNNSIPTGRYQLCFTPFKLWWVFYLRVVFQYKAVGCCTIVDLHLDFCPGWLQKQRQYLFLLIKCWKQQYGLHPSHLIDTMTNQFRTTTIFPQLSSQLSDGKDADCFSFTFKCCLHSVKK